MGYTFFDTAECYTGTNPDGTTAYNEKTMAQVCLGWMIRKKPWIVPIPGTRSTERMKENLASADVALSAEDIAKIDEALNKMNLVNTATRRTNTPQIAK